jgi:hypothetical protein
LDARGGEVDVWAVADGGAAASAGDLLERILSAGDIVALSSV